MAMFTPVFTASVSNFDTVFSTNTANFTATFGAIKTVIVSDTYNGEYEITPTDREQIISTKNLLSTDNFKIKAIPSNYGKISYDGATITIT